MHNSGGGDSPNDWEHRRHATRQMIRQEAPDVFGVQGRSPTSCNTLDESAHQYARVGVGRDDGDKAGETAAIYYLRDRFDLLDSGTLSAQQRRPNRPSRGWDGAYNRTMT